MAAARSTASGSTSAATVGRLGSGPSAPTAPPRQAAGSRRAPSCRSPTRASAAPWPLRRTDVDLHGHVNNAVYWQAIEELLPVLGPDPAKPLRAWLDYREPLDLGDELELTPAGDGRILDVGFVVGESVRAVARIEPLA